MNRIYLLILVLFCTMCKQSPQQENTIYVDLDRPERASLFDYFHSIELIPLETSLDVVISHISKEMLDDKQKEIFERLMQSKAELNPVLIKYWFK